MATLEGRSLEKNVFTMLKVNYFQYITLYPDKPSIKKKIKTFSDTKGFKH